MANSVPTIPSGEITFVGSFPDVAKAPKSDLPEFAFIGRSNVGKSSLINYLCDRKKLAKISGTPGKTQYINLFNVQDEWMLADLPGYGYAKISKRVREKWGKLIDHYLMKRENLKTAFLLIDSRHDAQLSDLEHIKWLGEQEIPFSIVFTKGDKLKPEVLVKRVDKYMHLLSRDYVSVPNHFVTSATGRQGREELLEFIAYVSSLDME